LLTVNLETFGALPPARAARASRMAIFSWRRSAHDPGFECCGAGRAFIRTARASGTGTAPTAIFS